MGVGDGVGDGVGLPSSTVAVRPQKVWPPWARARFRARCRARGRGRVRVRVGVRTIAARPQKV